MNTSYYCATEINMADANFHLQFDMDDDFFIEPVTEAEVFAEDTDPIPTKKPRFDDVCDDDVENSIANAKNKNTTRKTESDITRSTLTTAQNGSGSRWQEVA